MRTVLKLLLTLAAMLANFDTSDWGARRAHAQKTLFDVDLTQGNAGTGIVSGGTWDNGWRVVNELTDRIVFDAGYKIAEGYIETTMTINENPIFRDKKINYFGGYEESHLRQGNAGDKVYLRTGKMNYDFSRPKGAGGPITLPYTELENGPVQSFEQPDIGSIVTWLNSSDDVTELTMKIEWKEGDQINFFTSGGNATAPASVMENYSLDEIRYGFIGGDKTYNISLVGARFLRFKMVDYNAAPNSTGDFDEDGDVDGVDLLQWQRELGNSYMTDGLALWWMNFGSARFTLVAVPEPVAGSLFPVGCGILAWLRRCRRSQIRACGRIGEAGRHGHSQ